jgi:hypothetical protein
MRSCKLYFKGQLLKQDTRSKSIEFWRFYVPASNINKLRSSCKVPDILCQVVTEFYFCGIF